jgi:hypothetical protein
VTRSRAGPGRLHPDQPHGRPPPLPGRARRASPHRRRTLDPGARGTAAVEGREGKAHRTWWGAPCGRTSFFPALDGGRGRVLALRPGSGDRPVRVWVQGPRRGARSARWIHPPTSFLLPCWKAGAWWARRGRAAAGCGLRATRAPRSSAARTARVRAARRRRLSVCREGCHDQLNDSACWTRSLLFTRQPRVVQGVLAGALLAAQVGWVVQPARSCGAE